MPDTRSATDERYVRELIAWEQSNNTVWCDYSLDQLNRRRAYAQALDSGLSLDRLHFQRWRLMAAGRISDARGGVER